MHIIIIVIVVVVVAVVAVVVVVAVVAVVILPGLTRTQISFSTCSLISYSNSHLACK